MRRAVMPADPRPKSWRRRIVTAAVWLGLAALVIVRCSPRPAHLPLESSVDGPPPDRAAGVVVFLHGYGGSLSSARSFVDALRRSGLPGDVSIVLVEGPLSTGFGHAWGGSAEEQATSRARVRSRLSELLGERGPPPARIVVAGFSQGAGMALDLAVEDPRIGAVASFSPCASFLRGDLPKREGLRVLLAHGTKDSRCPVNESRSLASVLEAAHKPARYIEFDGPHTVPAEAVRALVDLAAAP